MDTATANSGPMPSDPMPSDWWHNHFDHFAPELAVPLCETLKEMRGQCPEFWAYEDRQIVTTGLNAVAGKKREEFSPEPVSYQDMRPGCYDPAARVADMDQGHVLASMMFPSFPRYCGQVFHEAKDRELGLLCVRAWNDFILEEFAAAYPGASSRR